MNAIIITGATSGIGYECAIHLCKKHPDNEIILTVRNIKAGNEIVNKLKQATGHKNVTCMLLDLESLESVRQFVAAFKMKANNQITALINNAGLQNVKETRYTKDGFELTFGVNHLVPLYLTLQLLPYMAGNARIIFTASGTHDPKQSTGMPHPAYTTAMKLAYPDKSELSDMKTGQIRYTTSKLCNVLTMYKLQQALANTNIHVNAFDPGFVPGTGLARNYPPFLKFISDYIFKVMVLVVPNVNSAQTSGGRLAALAVDERYKNTNGKYFEGEKEIKSSDDSYRSDLQNDLWNTSLHLLNWQDTETGNGATNLA